MKAVSLAAGTRRGGHVPAPYLRLVALAHQRFVQGGARRASRRASSAPTFVTSECPTREGRVLFARGPIPPTADRDGSAGARHEGSRAGRRSGQRRPGAALSRVLKVRAWRAPVAGGVTAR